MEESVGYLWKLVCWYIGLNVTKDYFVVRHIMKIQEEMNIGKDIKKSLAIVVIDLDEIKNALKGDYDAPGLVTKHYDLEKRVAVIEEK